MRFKSCIKNFINRTFFTTQNSSYKTELISHLKISAGCHLKTKTKNLIRNFEQILSCIRYK